MISIENMIVLSGLGLGLAGLGAVLGFNVCARRSNVSRSSAGCCGAKAQDFSALEKSLALNSLTEHVIFHSPDLRIVWANKAAADSVGLPADQLAGKLCYELWHKRSHACDICPVRDALTSRAPKQAEVFSSDKKAWLIRGYPVFDAQGGVTGVLEVSTDISELKKAEVRVHDLERRYHDLFEHANDMIFFLDPEGKIAEINPAVHAVLGFTVSEAKGKSYAEFLCAGSVEAAHAVFADVMKGNLAANVELCCRKKDGTECLLNVNAWAVFNDAGGVNGIYCAVTDVTNQKMMFERMRQMVIQIVSMLSETVSVADRDTEKHCERIQEFSLRIGKKLELSEKEIEHLRFASLLHDVGKVGIPINILIKKEKLTDEEWQRIKEHPKKGADIVRQLSGFEDVATIIEQHQERFDGKGYPRGLREHQIKREAAIISVVDAFDAMTSDRPYRKAMSIQDAIKELQKNAGTQFCPEVVQAFIQIITQEAA